MRVNTALEAVSVIADGDCLQMGIGAIADATLAREARDKWGLSVEG